MKDDRVYLLHIRDAINRILSYTAEGKEAFFTDTRTQDAVIRNLEVIGEATKNLSVTVKESSPGVPWKTIAGMRDKMIHEYFGVNLQVVWEVVERHLPEFGRQIAAILGSFDSG